MASPRRCPVLPDEIISDEIIARLPAKSVLGCRRLSRGWAATLTSDDFIDCYHAVHGGRPKIFRLQDGSRGDADEEAKSCIPIAVTGECFPRYVMVSWDEDPDPEPGLPDPILVTTHCRGLVLLELFPTGIHFVCNPSTGQKRALPEGRTTGCRNPRDLTHKYASLGLGYDARSRRHKVVRIYYRGRDSEGRPAASMGCEVYVVNDRDEDSAGLWRSVNSRPAGWMQPWKPSFFGQGHLYWFAHEKHELHRKFEGKIIVSFSISQETFGTVAPPPAHIMDDEAWQSRCLTELGGRLCLFSWGPPGYEHRYDVWLLHRDESSTRWDLYCRIDAGTTSPEVNRVMISRYGSRSMDFVPLVITDNGHRILLAQNECPEAIWAYTPSTGDIEKFLDLKSVVDKKNQLLEVAVYEENIACPGRKLPMEIVLASSLSTQALLLVLRFLPEHTLRRLMCVCRSWCTMIAMHLFNASGRIYNDAD
ncbi:unnamed protein product [Alopecurus aequalis]